MIRARLRSTSLAPDISVQAFKQTVNLGRSVVCHERKRSRHKAYRYAQYVRARSFARGYQEGLAQAQHECLAALQALRNCYEDALSAAKNDAHALATALAERIIDSSLIERPEVLMAWIQEGLQVLKRARTLHLSYQPRYTAMMERIAPHLPQGITTTADGSLGEADFVISSESGGIEFSWRGILHDKPTPHSVGAM